MKVYNENKTEVLKSYDLTKGLLKPDKILKEKHEAEQKRIDNIIENKKKENKTGEEFSLSVLDMLY